jgi:hypothetical protein
LADFVIKQGDNYPPLRATLRDQDGPIDLTTALEVRLVLRSQGSGLAFISGDVTFPDAAGGEVQYAWLEGDTDDIQSFNGEFEITWPDGKIQTVPNDGYFTVEVKPDLD